LNNVTLTRSGVGRSSGSAGTGSFLPRHLPPMIRILPGALFTVISMNSNPPPWRQTLWRF
jgi:hypothetical protein